MDLHSDFIPSHITGRISGPSPDGERDLAIAVNGRIVAVCPSFSLEGSSEEDFSALAPEAAFSDGENRVEVLQVLDTGGRLRLERLGATG